MGKYVNETSMGELGSSFTAKCAGLIADGAVRVEPTGWQENLVCVVDNGLFAAAGWAWNEREFEAFTQPSDTRPKAWYVWDKVQHFAH